MDENKFETEEERQVYMQAVIGICYMFLITRIHKKSIVKR